MLIRQGQLDIFRPLGPPSRTKPRWWEPRQRQLGAIRLAGKGSRGDQAGRQAGEQLGASSNGL